MRVNVALDSPDLAPAGAREGFGPFLDIFLSVRSFVPRATEVDLSPGILGQKAFAERMALAVARNHADDTSNATLGACSGLGFVAPAILVKAPASSATLAGSRSGSIDHVKARGGATDDRSTWCALLGESDLLALAVTVMSFQAASGAMRPVPAQARTAAGSDPGRGTGTMTVVAAW